MSTHRHLTLAIILLAFALRLHQITYHSFWFDEAVSVHWARQTVPRILEVGFTLQEDRLPPLYYLLLKGWATLIGWSEFSLRALSAFMGVLLIPAMHRLTQRLYQHRPLTLLTSLLIALNPFLIWYSQEARMYAQAVLFATLALNYQLSIINYQLSIKNFSFLTSHLLFILSATAALYSHLYAGFLLPALGLWLFLSYPRQWRLLGMFALDGLLITLAYSPILRAIWQFSGEATPGDPLHGITTRAWWLLHAFTVWQAPLAAPWPTIIPATIGLLALLGTIPFKSRPTPIKHPTLLITLLFITPFLIANLLLTRNYLAFFGERYFIIMLPWLLLLVAKAMNNYQLVMSKVSPLTSYFLFLTPYFLFLTLAQWNPQTTKEAWRQSVAYLADHATAQDAILIHPDWVRYPFQFYFHGPGQTYAAFSDVNATTDLDNPLQGIISDHPVIWLIQSHQESPDPQHLVEQWLANRYPIVTELYPPGISLKGYAPGYQMKQLPPTATPLNHAFHNGLKLVGYQADNTASATDTLFHPPSGWLHVTLYWSAPQPISMTASPVVQVVGAEGVWGVSLERATDALKLYPPSRWSQGQIIRQDSDVNLNPATPTGTYSLKLNIAEEQVVLGTVEVK